MTVSDTAVAITEEDKAALHKIAASEKKSDKQKLHEILQAVSIVPRDGDRK